MSVRGTLPLLALLLLLASCGQGTVPPASTPSPGFPSLTPFFPETFTPTASLTPLPSQTPLPSLTPTPTASLWATLTRFQTPNPHSYVFPVQPSNLTGFTQGGHPYPAIDIFILDQEECCQFVAVTSGVVDFVQTEDLWDPVTDDPDLRGGISVAIIGDDGVRYYGSHLLMVDDPIQVGARVTAGQFIGWVGATGDARDTPPHLHFGISHPTYPEDSQTRRGEVDPYPYLTFWLEGRNVTPVLP